MSRETFGLVLPENKKITIQGFEFELFSSIVYNSELLLYFSVKDLHTGKSMKYSEQRRVRHDGHISLKKQLVSVHNFVEYLRFTDSPDIPPPHRIVDKFGNRDMSYEPMRTGWYSTKFNNSIPDNILNYTI